MFPNGLHPTAFFTEGALGKVLEVRLNDRKVRRNLICSQINDQDKNL